MLKKLMKISGFKLSLLVTVLISFLYITNLTDPTGSSFLNLLDKQVIDFIMKSRATKPHSDQIAIVTIDTKAIDEFGRWPWPRNRMAKLIEDLNNYYGVNTIGLDIVFSEPDQSYHAIGEILDTFQKLESVSGESVLRQRLRQTRTSLEKELNYDQLFADVLKKYNNIVLGYFIWTDEKYIEHMSKQEIKKVEERIQNSQIGIIQGDANTLKEALFMNTGVAVEPNTELLSDNENLHGALNFIPDPEDGIARRVHLVWENNGRFYPSLDLQIFKRALGAANIRLVGNEAGIEGVVVGETFIPTAFDASIMVNYKGPANTFPHYSYSDVIHHKIPVEKLKNKIVLVGGTEVGVFDLRATPVGASYPGVEVHANVLDNLIRGEYLFQDSTTQLLSLVFILVFGCVLGLILPKLEAIGGAIFSLILLLSYMLANVWFLNQYQIWTSFIYIGLVIILNWFLIVLYQFLIESRDKRFIKGAFKQYLSPQVIDDLCENPDLLNLGGERKILTAFFSDVQGFSTISESLQPEELVELLNEYLTEMTDIIMKYDGTVDKFEGDAIIAFFGAPISHEDHAIRSCLASLEMQERLAEMRENWKHQGKHELFMRIGLNTGSMVVGNMGSKTRMDYTMMGDSVNLAARLEGVNKQYKTFTMISEFTYEDVKDTIEARELDMIRVVGKNEPVRIYEVCGRKGEVDQDHLQAYAKFIQGLKAYRELNWDKAIGLFQEVLRLIPGDGPATTYMNRCEQFKLNPPVGNWDGVYQMTSK